MNYIRKILNGIQGSDCGWFLWMCLEGMTWGYHTRFSSKLKRLLALSENTYNKKSHLDDDTCKYSPGCPVFVVLKSSLYTLFFWYSSVLGGVPTTKASSQKHNSKLENRKYTSMPWVGSEPTAQVLERYTAGHSLHRVTIMVDKYTAAVGNKVNLRRD
jgi:hypothetical protein